MRAIAMAVLLVAAAVPAHADVRVAVLEFVNGSADKTMDPLGKGLQSMVTTDLAQVPGLQLVERERLRDIAAEIELGRSAMIDKTTAAKLGKLLGATHLCAGTFTIVAGKMRLDTRLFSAQTGEVVHAEKIEGPRDEFFDLEKSLVKKLVEAAGVKLGAKERVAVERVHTTSFDAFRKYSDALQSFDERRYDDALAALREAAALDADFKLALTTLEEYQRVIQKVSRKVSEIELKDAREDAEDIAYLEKQVAAGKHHELFEIYQILRKQPDTSGDRFARDRAIDEVARRQYELSMPRWRAWLATMPPNPSFKDHLPKAHNYAPVMGVDFLRYYETSTDLRGGRRKELQFLGLDGTDKGLVDIVRLGNDYIAGVELHMNERQIVALQEELTKMAIAVVGINPWYHFSERDFGRGKPDLDLVKIQTALRVKLAGKLRTILELERSTHVLEDAARGTEDKDDLRAITAELELNRDLEALLAGARDRDQMRQLLQGRWLSDIRNRPKVLAAARRPELKIERRFAPNDYVRVGDVPVWLVRGELLTGRRSDDRQADEIRYYVGPGENGAWAKKVPAEAVGIVDGRRRASARLSFVLDGSPGADWSRSDPVEGRPEIGFVFGLRDVVSQTAPMRGYALLFGGPTVRLAELSGERTLELKVLAEEKRDLSSQRKLTVAIQLDGNAVTATVNGGRLVFRVPAAQPGYLGLCWRGAGFAAVRALKLEPSRDRP